MTPRSGTFALVTGASSGIGEAFARALAGRGYALVLAARSAGRLEALVPELLRLGAPEVLTVPVDLSEPDGARRLFEATEGNGRPVDLLVNNAGAALHGLAVEVPLERVTELLRVNVVAATELAHLCAAAMGARRHGRIVNVASTMAFLPDPYFAAYGASKAYLLSLSLALHVEVEPDGVVVTALCPGFTRTGFYAAAGMKGPEGTPFPEMTAAEVAEIGLAAAASGKAIAITHPLDRVWIFVSRFVPRVFAARLAKRLYATRAAR